MADQITRRELIKRTAYLTPVILTLRVAPAFASSGSGSDSWHQEKEYDRHQKNEHDENEYDGNKKNKHDDD